MQFKKTSKKTRNIAEQTNASAPEKNAAAEVTTNPRTTRSSTTKKTETTETGSVKHRHNKVNSSGAPETAAPSATNGKALAATAGSASVIMDPVGVITPTPENQVISSSPELEASRVVAHEEIAKLAYSYWIARGYSHGAAEEDWLRAERELRQRR